MFPTLGFLPPLCQQFDLLPLISNGKTSKCEKFTEQVRFVSPS